MKAFLDALEKFLTWFFAISFALLAGYGVLRYQQRQARAQDPWLLAQRSQTQEAYAAYLKQCEACPHEEEARQALDDLQRRQGLLARLSRDHLKGRASISLPSFSADGQLILATSGEGPEFWETQTGRHSDYGQGLFDRARSRVRIDHLALAPDGHRIGAGTGGIEGGRLLVWDLQSEKRISEQEVEGFDVKDVLFAADNSWLGWRGDGPVGVWDPGTQRFFRGTHDGVKSIAFLDAGDGHHYFVTANDRELWLWDRENLSLIRQGGLQSERPLLGISRDGRIVVHADARVLEVWDTEQRELLAELRDLEGEIRRFCRDSRSGRLVVATDTGLLYLWDPKGSALPQGSVVAHQGPVEELACSGLGQVVSVGWDSAKVWDLERLSQAAAEPTTPAPAPVSRGH